MLSGSFFLYESDVQRLREVVIGMDWKRTTTGRAPTTRPCNTCTEVRKLALFGFLSGLLGYSISTTLPSWAAFHESRLR